jgi:hypothetical protein
LLDGIERPEKPLFSFGIEFGEELRKICVIEADAAAFMRAALVKLRS